MAVQLTGLGGLFTRLGKIGRIAQSIAGSEAALIAPFFNLINQYDSTLQYAIAPVSLIEDRCVRNNSSVMAFAQQLATTTVLGMVSADVPVITTLPLALQELRRQMLVYNQSVAKCNLSINPVALQNKTGNGVLVTTTKRGDGLTNDNMIAEQPRLICTADSYTGGATVGSEQFTFTGDPQNAGVWDYDWPQGSNAFVGFNAVRSSQYGSATGNILVNGDFGNGVAANKSWTLTGGAFGTDVIQSSQSYQGLNALEFAPTNKTLTLVQTFGSAAGSSVVPTPLTSYAINFWLAAMTGTVTTGTLVIELIDGNNALINDAQGTPNQFTIDLTTVPLTYTPYNAVFRLASPPPATVQLRFRLSVGVQGTGVLLDSVAMTAVTQAYTGGPGLALFSGSIPFVFNDGWTVWTANDRAGQAYLGTFQALFDKLFGTRAGGYLLPTSGAPTISDTLISQGGTSGTPMGALGNTYP